MKTIRKELYEIKQKTYQAIYREDNTVLLINYSNKEECFNFKTDLFKEFIEFNEATLKDSVAYSYEELRK